MFVCASLAFAAACSKEDKPAPTEKPTTAKTPEPVKPPEPAPKAMTDDDKVAWYKGCWDAWSKKDWAAFDKCYAADAESEHVDSGMPAAKGKTAAIEIGKSFTTAYPDITGEPQLILVKGDWLFSVVLIRGTHTAPLATPMGELPPTNKKVGYMVGHAVQMSDKGAVKDWFFGDQGTILAQLGQSPMPARPAIEQGWADKPVVIAKGDQKEKDNEAVSKAGIEAFNKHDVNAFLALLADDVVWSEAAMPADMDKKAAGAGMTEFFKSFSDIKITPEHAHGIGDWVVTIGGLAGTNDGDMPSMKMPKTGKPVQLRFIEFTRLDGGKMKGNWLFYNGLAMAAQLGMIPPKAEPDQKGGKKVK
jgi:steroid delta-isomerase-like uncharacterized protein